VYVFLKNIAILGSGSWGTALAYTLSKNNNIILWSYFEQETKDLEEYRENRHFLKGVILPKKVEFTSSLEKALEKSEIIIFAVPSFAIRQTALSVSPFFNKDTQIAVCVAKGLEEDTSMTLSEVIEDCLPKGSKVCALSGPTHAEEVSKDIPTTIVCACSDIEVAKKVQTSIMNKFFRVYTTDDIKGVELGGTIKNIIALCAGISDGIGYGDNTKAALMTRGMYEISKLGVAMGGRAETFYGLSGMGDLIVTCTSMHSRNRRCGMLIGQGMKVDDALKEVNMVVEGIKCLKAVKDAADNINIEMPIINEAYNVVYKGEDPRKSVYNLMTRDKKHEN
jgi:glycerol-3-phosphate dehydrogenase (NAD(P)+)